MTPKEVLEKFKIVKGRAEPRHEVIDVEGNFDRIVYNENGKFAGYLYNSEPSEPGKEKEKIRVFLPDGKFPKFDDPQFLLFKHVIVTGEVTVRPDMNPNDSYDTEELQIEVKKSKKLYDKKLDKKLNKKHDIRVLGESTSRKWIVVRHDKHPHKRRELPHEPLNIAVLSSKGSQGCNDFACIIASKVYNRLDYFYPENFTPAEIKIAIDDIIKKAKKGGYNCLCIVRGGGPQESLNVFNELIVVDSLKKARGTMYVVTGIGHSNDSTKCDEVADYCAYTPTHAAFFFNSFNNSI